MDWLAAIFIFFLVIVVTAVLFCGWIILTMVRLTFRGIGALFGPGATDQNGKPRPVQARASNLVRCPTPRCGAMNPVSARFCRRCGRGLPAAQKVQVRRAAVW